jgi:hypothetical protein
MFCSFAAHPASRTEFIFFVGLVNVIAQNSQFPAAAADQSIIIMTLYCPKSGSSLKPRFWRSVQSLTSNPTLSGNHTRLFSLCSVRIPIYRVFYSYLFFNYLIIPIHIYLFLICIVMYLFVFYSEKFQFLFPSFFFNDLCVICIP